VAQLHERYMMMIKWHLLLAEFLMQDLLLNCFSEWSRRIRTFSVEFTAVLTAIVPSLRGYLINFRDRLYRARYVSVYGNKSTVTD